MLVPKPNPSERQITHLAEHLPYEVLMLRHTHSQLHQEQSRLDWNAFLESFASHARNLIDFLTNRGDNRNFTASDFERTYRAKSHQDLMGAMEKLRYQILHFGKRRPLDQDKKLSLGDAHRLFQWIENEIPRFIVSLCPEYRASWTEERANPSSAGPQRVKVGEGMLRTTTSIPVITVVGFHRPPKPPRSDK
jgi:hypothetical protein